VQTKASAAARKIIRKRVVEEQTGLSGTTIWREEKAGRFPTRIQISANAVGWFQDEISDWIHQRIRGRKIDAAEPARAARRERQRRKAQPPQTVARPQGSRPRQTFRTGASR
jgi:prophage regulatory protein